MKHRTSPSLVRFVAQARWAFAFRRAAAVLGWVTLASACPEDAGDGPPPTLEQPIVFAAGDGDATIGLVPFSVRLVDASGEVVQQTAPDDGERCAPLFVGIRADDDSGDRFHKPEDPRDGTYFVRSTTATVLRFNDALELQVRMSDDEGLFVGNATVVIRSGAEGFLDVDVTWPFAERSVAFAGTCVTLASGEHVVGGGERFDGADLTGRQIPFWFQAPGPYASGTNEAHAPIAALFSSRGAAMWLETERVAGADIGATKPDATILRTHGATLPLRLRVGTIEDNVAARARRVGLPPVPPLWALAPQQWRNEHEITIVDDEVVSNGEDRMRDDARTLRELGIPTTAMWIDAPWSTGYNTFAFNELQWDDPDQLLSDLEDDGFRVIIWATEFVNRSDDSGQQPGMPAFGSLEMYEEYRDNGWLVANPDGTPFVFGWPRGDGAHVDFTHPDATAAYQERIRALVERGVRGFKLDYGETMRPELLGLNNDALTFADGSTTAVQHVRYARLYHEAFLDVLREVHPDDHFIITRTGGPLDEKNGVALWPGDLDNDFKVAGEPDPAEGGAPAVGGLPAAVSGAISSSLSGYPLYGSDIGGYRGGPSTREVYFRWVQAGALQTIMQLGGGGTGDATHNPWDTLPDGSFRYGEDAVDLYRRYARLHMDLLPTLREMVARASTGGDGSPPLVPLGARFPAEEGAWSDPNAYFFGADLLVAPVVDDALEKAVWIPPGDWQGFFDGELYEGDGSVRSLSVPLDELALFQPAGSVLLLGDPRLMTAAESTNPEVADLDAYGDGRVFRFVAGGEARQRSYREGTGWTMDTRGGLVELSLTAPSERMLVAEWRPRDDGTGPDATGPFLVDGVEASLVDESAGEDAFFECDAPCARVLADGRVQVLARGLVAEMTLGTE